MVPFFEILLFNCTEVRSIQEPAPLRLVILPGSAMF